MLRLLCRNRFQRILILIVLLAFASVATGVGIRAESAEAKAVRRLHRVANGQLLIRDMETDTWVAVTALPSRVTVAATLDGRTIYAGTETDGLLRSVDGGVSWRPADNAGLGAVPGSALAVTALVVDSTDTDHIVAATAYWLGTSRAEMAPYGVFESRDGGRSWHSLTQRTLPGKVVQLTLDPGMGAVTAQWVATGELAFGLVR
jgi:hypothetical protein